MSLVICVLCLIGYFLFSADKTLSASQGVYIRTKYNFSKALQNDVETDIFWGGDKAREKISDVVGYEVMRPAGDKDGYITPDEKRKVQMTIRDYMHNHPDRYAYIPPDLQENQMGVIFPEFGRYHFGSERKRRAFENMWVLEDNWCKPRFPEYFEKDLEYEAKWIRDWSESEEFKQKLAKEYEREKARQRFMRS